MGKATGREGGAVHRVYLTAEREGALQAYREHVEETTGRLPPVNAILLKLLVSLLEEEGWLLRGTLKSETVSHKERDNGAGNSTDRRK